MSVPGVRGIGRVHVGPTTGYLEIRGADLEEVQDPPDRAVHEGRQLVEFLPFVEVGTRLPTPAGGRLRTASSDPVEPGDEALVESSTDLWRELGLPNERRKHAHDIRLRKHGLILSSHRKGPGAARVRAPDMMIVRSRPRAKPSATGWWVSFKVSEKSPGKSVFHRIMSPSRPKADLGARLPIQTILTRNGQSKWRRFVRQARRLTIAAGGHFQCQPT